MKPTIKTLAKHFNISAIDARKVRKALDNWGKPNPSLDNRYRISVDCALNLAGEVLNAIDPCSSFGTEVIRGEDIGGYWGDVRAVYLNTGDTYNATLVYDRATNNVCVTTMGDYVEKLQGQGEKIV